MDLYIFGAGASAAEGAPVTHSFFARAFEYLAPAFDERVGQVWEFLETVFEAQISGPEAFAILPPVDEVISLIDWCLHVDQGLGPYDTVRLYQVRRAIEHLLCAALDEVQDRLPFRQDGPYLRFARALAGRSPDSYALISLNYDTLLDDALRAAGIPACYGLDGAAEKPLLLKLHGSLNWAHCAACDQIEVARQQVAHLLPRVAGLSCSRCGNNRLSGVIISPTWLKRYTLPPLTRVFDLALQMVQQARRIVFVGYSLPPADVAIHQLIRRGMLTRCRQERPVVEVINHGGARELQERFVLLFGPGVRFDFSGFHGQT